MASKSKSPEDIVRDIKRKTKRRTALDSGSHINGRGERTRRQQRVPI